MTPTLPGATIDRESVMVEWTDRDIANTTFEGTAREVLRMQLPSPIHPLGEMTFNPTARRGDPDWRVMYIGVGDCGYRRAARHPPAESAAARQPGRQDPAHRARSARTHATSTVSENGRYRIPNDNPFASVEGARKEIWAAGLRNPHRLIWDVDPAQPRAPRLFAFSIGLASWETVVIVKKGANYGYPLREGPQARTPKGWTPVPADDTIPLQITDTVTRGTVKPTYPVIAYPHAASGGDAIAGGVVYRGSRIPALKGKLLFGDITTGHVWYADMADVLGADDGNPATLAPMHEIDAGLRRLVEETFRARGAQVTRCRRRRRRGSRPRGRPVRRGQRRRALRPDEERRHDPAGRGFPVRSERRPLNLRRARRRCAIRVSSGSSPAGECRRRRFSRLAFRPSPNARSPGSFPSPSSGSRPRCGSSIPG